MKIADNMNEMSKGKKMQIRFRIMRKRLLLSILISLMALPLLSFKSVEKTKNKIIPKVALVVASKPTSGNLGTNKEAVAAYIKNELINNAGVQNIEYDDKYESHTIYTIQTGSFIFLANARNQFDTIIQGLREQDLNSLRIEKIGRFNVVRVGKFEDHATAEKFLKSIKSRLSTAIILKAYIKNDRIVSIY